jgi:pimeloyl-ACP methyl ester carboxylesterase
MHRSSLVRRTLGLALGLALLSLSQPGGAARAEDKFTKVTFDTVDGVTLQGTFYPSAKGKDEPTVLLLHKIGSDSHKDGWDDLAKALNDKGYAVLSFDFRGHGNSTSVDPDKFWKFAWNRGASKTGPMEKGKWKDSISKEGFVPGYYPYLLNDIAAAKLFLDDRNDASDCNSRSLIVIGAEDGAALGAVWMASEWSRVSADVIPDPRGPRFPPFIRNIGKEPAGKDQFCAIWLSLTPSLGSGGSKTSAKAALYSALKYVGQKQKLPMGFLYGDKDADSEGHAKEFVKVIKGDTDPANDKFPLTASHAVEKTKLAGSALLRKDLTTNDLILKYLDRVRDKRVTGKWSKVEWDRTAYVWAFPDRRPVLAKEEKAKAFEPIPLPALGLGGP